MTQTQTLTLTTLDGELAVEDSDGGVWRPCEEVAEMLRGLSDAEAEAEALRLCIEEPMRGVWQD